MSKLFAKVWLVAMLVSGGVTAVAIWQTGSSWVVYSEAMLFVGGLTWAIWFLIGGLMPWIER